ADARVRDTAAMTLDEIEAEFIAAAAAGKDVARVHSGDPSLYGALAEQMRRLDRLGIDYTITPGVPAFTAAAAALGIELTVPGIAQTVTLTRTAMRATAMPDGEDLATQARSGGTLAIHLSTANLANVVRTLAPVLGEDCPVALVYRASQPDQRIVAGTLATIRERVKAAGFARSALILVGRALEAREFRESRLYDPAHHHASRPRQR
ncbi:MAG: SAM-dependent methyltransferase, partial [Alphaproteobacteria bacterium]|nr:SAM-dependent methyltransferase [Alphaproteobacteria bacterium]